VGIGGRKRLGVNVDHVATLRQARGGVSPDPVTAASIAELAGADGITVHLREDRRHIQDRDLRLLSQTVKTRINFEMAATGEMIGIAAGIKPYSSTIVPERRQELTTEGGLDVSGREKDIAAAVSTLHGAGIAVSLFIDPDPEQMKAAKRVGADAVEIHTGTYCEAFASGRPGPELDKIGNAAVLGRGLGLLVFAGHGLDLRNIVPILSMPEIEEFNIGHSLIARAVFVGLSQAVAEMADLIHGS
jgi:pyridoxine 5-phosphate synthase